MFRKQISMASPILQAQSMGLRIRCRREINYGFENERKQHTAEMKTFRKTHLEEYWNTQTQAENMFLQKFKVERAEK